MSSRLKRIIVCFVCFLLLLSVVCVCLMISRGPKVAFMADYSIRFKDRPSAISRKMHLDLGTPKEWLEWDETVYNAETDILGVRSKISFSFLGGSQLYKVVTTMPINDSAQIETAFQKFIALIEAAYENNAELEKSNVRYTNEYEYGISIDIPVTGATWITYNIEVTNGMLLTISGSYYW